MLVFLEDGFRQRVFISFHFKALGRIPSRQIFWEDVVDQMLYFKSISKLLPVVVHHTSLVLVVKFSAVTISRAKLCNGKGPFPPAPEQKLFIVHKVQQFFIFLHFETLAM